MSQITARIDPQWAWAPFVPSREQPWNQQLAAHLLRRAGFGGNRRQLLETEELTPAEAVNQLIDPSGMSAEFLSDSEQFAQTILAGGDPKKLSAWWVYTILRTPHPLLEKMTLFWHGHFATSAEKVQDAESMYQQNQLLRRSALGDFAAMAHAVSRDPAMLIYLDSVTNRKAHPNENYARELMELFCLGEGAYTEQDVQQLARCFTGWEIRRGRFRFNRYQHDNGVKTIFGNSDTFPDAAAVDLVLRQPAAPRFIAGKLVRYFVADELALSAELVEPLAVQLRQHDWDISQTVRTILGSNLFFSDYALGRKIRSPIDLMVGLLRCLEGSTNASQLAEDLVELGQGLFYPPNVKGWDGGRAWINSSTLLGRANLVGRVVRDESTRFGGTDLESYVKQLGATTPDEVIDTLEDLLLAVPIPLAAREQLVGLMNSVESDSIAATIHALSTLPEFQLG